MNRDSIMRWLLFFALDCALLAWGFYWGYSKAEGMHDAKPTQPVTYASGSSSSRLHFYVPNELVVHLADGRTWIATRERIEKEAK